MDRIKNRLTSAEAMSMSLSEIERLVGAEGHELLRELMQTHVDLRAAKEEVVEVTGADGVERTQVRQGTRTVETPHGEIAVTRKLYQAAGVVGLAPLDAALGLPDEHYSLEVRRLVAEESARASFDEVYWNGSYVEDDTATGTVEQELPVEAAAYCDFQRLAGWRSRVSVDIPGAIAYVSPPQSLMCSSYPAPGPPGC